MKVVVLLVLLAVVGYSSAALPVVPCSKNTKMNLTINSLRVMTTPECETFPCALKRGSNATIVVSFEDVAGGNISKLDNKLYGIIAGIPVPFPGFPTEDVDVCSLASDASSKCPIKNGDKFTEKVSLPVISSAPAMKVTAKWELVNPDTKRIEGCFEALLQLT